LNDSELIFTNGTDLGVADRYAAWVKDVVMADKHVASFFNMRAGEIKKMWGQHDITEIRRHLQHAWEEWARLKLKQLRRTDVNKKRRAQYFEQAQTLRQPGPVPQASERMDVDQTVQSLPADSQSQLVQTVVTTSRPISAHVRPNSRPPSHTTSGSRPRDSDAIASAKAENPVLDNSAELTSHEVLP
jgi:hypothetical protein